MTSKEKKQYAENLMKHGDKRSYNEIQADLELYLWKKRFTPEVKPAPEAE